MTTSIKNAEAFREVPYMGVIYVLHEAFKLGFQLGDPNWSNLGQGQPEVGPMEGAPTRIDRLEFSPQDHAYGEINGTPEARQCVADYYNRLYRKDRTSKYSADNVSLACGGRLVLARIMAALGTRRFGYKIPDYTAYEDLFNAHLQRCEPVLIPSEEKDGFNVTPQQLENAIHKDGIGAFVVSNPCNPTGMVVRDEDLEAYVAIARRERVTLVLDEFYSHFIYDGDGPGTGPVSAAVFVDDVDVDPVLLVDGLTKNQRYPGWRVGWAVGPQAMIEVIGRVASAIDGGPSRPLQRLLLAALEPARADQETAALRRVFSKKRNLMVARLQSMGLKIPVETSASFYTWASVADLPAPLNTADGFFRAALRERVITVPGPFFDVNPGGLRKQAQFETWLRFSFGPDEANLLQGLERLDALIAKARN